MSERRPQGPLDRCRGMIMEAEELDRLGQLHVTQESEMYGDFAQSVFMLTEQNPLMHEEVIIYGRQLTVAADAEGITPFALGANEEGDIINGLYAGLAVVLVYDTVAKTENLRVVHMVYTGSTDSEFEDDGNKYQKHFYEYVCVQGSDMQPVHPTNAHSLEELAADGVLAEIDSISFNEAMDLGEKIRRIGNCMNNILRQSAGLETDLNHQRMSYINSLGLLDGSVVRTRDMLLANKETYLNSSEVYFSDMTRLVEVYPHILEIAPSYRRGKHPEGITFENCPEVFLSAIRSDGQPVLAPLRSIIEVS